MPPTPPQGGQGRGASVGPEVNHPHTVAPSVKGREAEDRHASFLPSTAHGRSLGGRSGSLGTGAPAPERSPSTDRAHAGPRWTRAPARGHVCVPLQLGPLSSFWGYEFATISSPRTKGKHMSVSLTPVLEVFFLQ